LLDRFRQLPAFTQEILPQLTVALTGFNAHIQFSGGDLGAASTLFAFATTAYSNFLSRMLP